MGFQKRFQDEDGGDLVDDVFAVAAIGGVAGGVENFMGCSSGEALVPEIDGDAEHRCEFVRKDLYFFRLWTDVAGHVQRIADDDVGAVVAAEQAAEGLDIGTAVAGAVEGEERLDGVAELIGNGHADAPVADIEGGDTVFCRIR